MPTITKTISQGGAGGANYSSLALWEAGIQTDIGGGTDLTAVSDLVVGQCTTAGGEFTAGVTIGGYTTNASFFITLTTAAGNSFRDNAGVRTNSLVYNSTRGVGIATTSGFLIKASQAYTVISNLQLKSTSPTNSDGCIWIANINVTVNDCILAPLGSGAVINTVGIEIDDTTALINRCAIYGLTAGGANPFCLYIPGSAAITANVNGSTIAVASDVTAGYGCYTPNAGPTVNWKNTGIFGCSTHPVFGSGTFTFTNCGSDTTGTFTGLTNNLTYANQLVGTTAATMDLREKSGANLFGAGVQDLVNDTNDITGLTRKNPPDIGAWEITASAPTRGKGGLLLFGIGSIGWTPSMIGAAALWKAGEAIRRNATLSRRSLLIGRK